MFSLSINGKTHDLDIEPETPMLWVLRDEIGLTGTKFGCGIAQCGACTIHVDGVATRSCQFPVERRRRQDDHDHRRAWAPDACIRCRRPGSRTTCRNAAIASPGRSWRRRASSRRIRRRPTPISTPRSPISAAAGPIRASAPRSIAPPRSPRLCRGAAMNAVLSRRSFVASRSFGGGRPRRRCRAAALRRGDAARSGALGPGGAADAERGQRLRRRSNPTTRSCCASPNPKWGRAS